MYTYGRGKKALFKGPNRTVDIKPGCSKLMCVWEKSFHDIEGHACMYVYHRETLEMPLAYYFHLSRQGQNDYFWWGVLFVILITQ